MGVGHHPNGAIVGAEQADGEEDAIDDQPDSQYNGPPGLHLRIVEAEQHHSC